MRRFGLGLLLCLLMTLFAGADSQKLWQGPVGPMFTVQLALGDGTATLSLRETAKTSNSSLAIGKFKLTDETLDIDVREVRFNGSGAGRNANGFQIETPRKGEDGVPTLKLFSGAHVHFKVTQSGDRLDLRGADGVQLTMHLKK